MTESPTTYALILPHGEEGPFTRDEICALLRQGKARADDRLRQLPSGKVSQVEMVVPDARELMKSAPPISDWIKRKSHNRTKVVIPLPGDPASQLSAIPVDGTPNNAAPRPATEPAQAAKSYLHQITESIAMAASEVAAQINAVAPPGNRLRGVKALVSLVAIPLSLWWIWGQLYPTYPKAYPLEGVAWTTQTTPGKPSLPDVRIVIGGDTMKITSDGTTSIHQMVLLSGTDGITFHLTPGHPLLGETCLIDCRLGPPVMITADRKRINLRQE